MGDVMSATVRGTSSAKLRDRYLGSAEALIVEAAEWQRKGDMEQAFECAYRAALRCAGARMATSSALAKRKRLPSGAWQRLSLVDSESAAWAQSFQAFSRLNERIATGVERNVSSAKVQEIIVLAERFLAAVSGADRWTIAA